MFKVMQKSQRDVTYHQ